MKKYMLLSALTVFVLPLALSAEDAERNQIIEETNLIVVEDRETNQSIEETNLVAAEDGLVAARDGCGPRKPVCPPKPKPKCVPKPKPCCWDDKECNPTNWSLQARGAAFLPLKHQLREIYGTAIPTVELEGSYSLIKWSDCLHFPREVIDCSQTI